MLEPRVNMRVKDRPALEVLGDLLEEVGPPGRGFETDFGYEITPSLAPD